MGSIYTYSSEQQQNLEEAREDAASAVEKLPALVELVNFIYEGSYGLDVEITEKSIDDAFDCIIDRNKAFIKASNLSKQDKDNKLNQIESQINFIKMAFKSSLKLKH